MYVFGRIVSCKTYYLPHDALCLDAPKRLISNNELQFQCSGYSKDYSPICNLKSNTLLYLCDNNIPDATLPILSHKQSKDSCLRRNHTYGNNSRASDRHISESGWDLIMAFVNSIISDLDQVRKFISFQTVLLLYALDRIVLDDSTTPTIPIYESHYLLYDVLRLDVTGKDIPDNAFSIGCSNDYSAIGKNITLLCLCHNNIPAPQRSPPIPSDNIKTRCADNDKSDSDASDRNISGSSLPQMAFINLLRLAISEVVEGNNIYNHYVFLSQINKMLLLNVNDILQWICRLNKYKEILLYTVNAEDVNETTSHIFNDEYEYKISGK